MKLKAAGWIKLSSLRLLTVIAISVMTGVVTYMLTASRSLTLVLEAKTLNKGWGTVTVEKSGGRGSVGKRFEIQDDQGLKKMYLIELPASRLESIKVAPLGPSGQFALDRIILTNGSGSYFWDERGSCSRQALRRGLLIREACAASAPLLTTAADGTVFISSISESEAVTPRRSRIAAALVFTLGALLGGAWLLWPGKNSSASAPLQRYAVKISWLVVAVLYVYQVYLVYSYSVDMPFQDNWDYFKASALSDHLSWRWLISFHVEDRLILTKLMAWLNLKLFGLDFDLQEMMNMLLYGGLLATLVGLKNRVAGRQEFQLFPLFLVFLLSTIAVENHLWSFQSMYHLVLLFSIAALYHAYNKPTYRSACAFSLLMVLAMLTFSAWVVFAVVYLCCISIYICAGMVGGRIERAGGIRFLLIVGMVFVVGLLMYYRDYVAPAWPPPKLYPIDIRFWEYFLNIVSLGFGFSRISLLLGVITLFLAICPLILLLVKKETRWQPSTWQVLSAILGILALLAAITLGRGNFGEPKTSRYSEFGSMLIPLSALAWWLAGKAGGRKRVMLPILWLLCLDGYFNDWSTQKYAESRQIELYNLECVEAYFNGIGDGICQGRTTASDLDRAKDMGAKFTRQFPSRHDGGR